MMLLGSYDKEMIKAQKKKRDDKFLLAKQHDFERFVGQKESNNDKWCYTSKPGGKAQYNLHSKHT